MTTQIDWQRELDASFGSGDDVPVGHYVAAGHTAVRRRRSRAVVAGLAAAAVVAGVAWGTAPGGSPRSTDAPVATDPSGTSQVSDGSQQWGEDEAPARLSGKGVEIRPGAVVHERREDLYPGKDTDSVALDVSFDGERWWVAMEWGDGSGASQSVQPGDVPFEDFDAFVQDQVQGGGMIVARPSDGPTRSDELVTWHGGRLDPAPGVTVVRQVADPVPGNESLGLVLQAHGVTTWMLLTHGGTAASWSLESDSGWVTFDQWLADQVAVQTGSPGVRLVRLAADGTVTPTAPSVEVLAQQADPDLPAYGTDEAGASAVALLEWQGGRWFVLAVRFPREVAVTTVAASKAGGAETLDQFAAFLDDKADEGGMR